MEAVGLGGDRARPVDALGRVQSGVALALVGVLSLVLLAAPDRGVASVLWRYGDTIGFLWRWGLAGLGTVAALYVLSDGGASARWPVGSSMRWVSTVGAIWLAGLVVGTFGFDVGTIEYLSLRQGVTAVLIVPLTEELLYRGAVFCLAERIRPAGDRLWLSFPVLASTILFSLGHLQGWEFQVGEAIAARYYVWANGLVYGVLRSRSRSIWPSVAVHSVGNGLAMIAGST